MLMLSKNRRRFLALGVLVILVLAFLVFIVQPYIYVLDASKNHLESVQFEYFNNDRLLRKKNYYIENLGIIEEAYTGGEVYLRSDKKSLATAEIQDIFNNLAESSNAELISTQVISDESNSDNSVGLSARLRADIFGLQQLIYEVESSLPRLVIKEASIRRGGRAIFRNKNEQSSSQTLEVRLEVFGYISTQ